MIRKMGRLAAVGVTFVAMLSASAPVFAFGETGHQAIGAMAAKLVSRQTLDLAVPILRVRPPEVAFRRVELWADQHPTPEILKWKGMALPATGGYDKARDCPDGACPVEKIAEMQRILGDKAATVDARSDAFAYLMHMVADVHMPLPAAAPPDLNGSWVKIGDKTQRLRLWGDDLFTAKYGADPLTVMDSLGLRLSAENEKGWAGGTPQQWQSETFNATRDFLAKNNLNSPDAGKTEANPIVLSAAQLDALQVFVGQQMQKAGVRLAWLLDQSVK